MGKYTETGLWEGSGTIVDAHFGIKPEYNPTAYLILFDIDTDDANLTEPVNESWSVGDRWMSNDGGETIHDPARPDRQKVNMQSQYGEFIDRAVTLSGGDGGVVDTRLERAGVLGASVWKGLRFRFERITPPPRKIRGEDVKQNDKLMPVEFLGEAGSGSSAATKTTPTSAPSSTTSINGEAREELSVLAKLHDSHNRFLDAAMQTEAGRAHMKELAVPATWEALRNA